MSAPVQTFCSTLAPLTLCAELVLLSVEARGPLTVAEILDVCHAVNDRQLGEVQAVIECLFEQSMLSIDVDGRLSRSLVTIGGQG